MRSHLGLGVIVFLVALAAASCGAEVRGGGGTGTGGKGLGGGGKGLGGGECRGADDCSDGLECYAPGEDLGCGVCNEPDVPCSSDADCQGMGDNSFCKTDNCVCGGECAPGCGADADCGAGEVCKSDHTCVKGCQADADCGPNMACDPFDKPHCAPAHCSSDADCAGYCIDQRCYATPGTCQETPA